MTLEIGNTVDGTIVKLAEYGAIVRLAGGKTGLIHISEVASSFVRDINDHFKEHDQVRVKVLSVNSKGRYQLSAKGIEQPKPEPAPVRETRRLIERIPDPVNLGPDVLAWDKSGRSEFGSFEDRLGRFLKDSDDRQLDLKRNIESKRGNRKR